MSNSILDLIGNTPMVESKVLNTNPNVRLFLNLRETIPVEALKTVPPTT